MRKSYYSLNKILTTKFSNFAQAFGFWIDLFERQIFSLTEDFEFNRDVPINRHRHRQVSAILGGIGIGIGIGKIWPILADSLNIITLLIFFRSDRFTSVFLT